MNKKAAIANAKANIKKQNELAAAGKDFSASVIMESERIIALAEKFAEELTAEEKFWLKIQAVHPNPDWSECKAIKDKLNVSWNEVKMIASWCVEQPVKIYRESKGITQKGLAEIAGIDIKTVQDFESGRKDINRAAAATVKKMAQALDCRMEDLID